MTPDLPRLAPGEVWLVGAGPGDPGLLTLLAARALEDADVVVHDALVDPGVLAMARAGARIVHAGKRGGRPSPCQPDISARLVAEAKAGARVLRLKGGDPFVFGRGGEEALALAAARVPFRVVPGVTAGIGGLAYAGIPATHRDANSAVTFVSGHAAPEAGGLDWEALARGSPALVFYMALKRIGAIADCLIGARPPAGRARRHRQPRRHAPPACHRNHACRPRPRRPRSRSPRRHSDRPHNRPAPPPRLAGEAGGGVSATGQGVIVQGSAPIRFDCNVPQS